MDQEDPMLVRLIDRILFARDHQAPLDIRGGGTKVFYGEPARGEPLDVSGLAGISSYEPTELVVTVRAGTRLADLEAALAEHGQCLPFEPPRFAAGGTVGGMVAAGLSGPARATVGAVRDHVLGVTLLNGRGEILTFGGQVAKNVAGYDVSRLIAGSLGILGVICEVSLKVLPINRATATLYFDWDERRALEQLNVWRSQPLPVNASAWQDGRLRVRLAGAAAAVSAACGKLEGAMVAPDAATAWWLGLRDQTQEFFSIDAAGLARGECLWRLSVPATAAPVQLPGRQVIEWHGAERWWRTTSDARVVRAAAAQSGGHATLIRGADKSAGVFTPLSTVLMRIHRGLKQAFDPACVLNPGRLYAEL
jgi:glycolate oxidase FAD binding subunit